MAYLYRCPNTKSVVRPQASNGKFTYEEIATLVGTDIVEAIYLQDLVMFVCEEGKMRDKVLNVGATQAAIDQGWISSVLTGDYIAGDALACFGYELLDWKE